MRSNEAVRCATERPEGHNDTGNCAVEDVVGDTVVEDRVDGVEDDVDIDERDDEGVKRARFFAGMS